MESSLRDAATAILSAVEANAAPMNVIYALREVSSQGKKIALDPELLIDLFKALGGKG